MILGTFRPSALGNAVSRSTAISVNDDDDIVEIPPPTAQCVGWAYVGSHNFTPSAWGTLSGSGFTPVLNVGPKSRLSDSRLTLYSVSRLRTLS